MAQPGVAARDGANTAFYLHPFGHTVDSVHDAEHAVLLGHGCRLNCAQVWGHSRPPEDIRLVADGLANDIAADLQPHLDKIYRVWQTTTAGWTPFKNRMARLGSTTTFKRQLNKIYVRCFQKDWQRYGEVFLSKGVDVATHQGRMPFTKFLVSQSICPLDMTGLDSTSNRHPFGHAAIQAEHVQQRQRGVDMDDSTDFVHGTLANLPPGAADSDDGRWGITNWQIHKRMVMSIIGKAVTAAINVAEKLRHLPP
ncbi:hypothetical protein GGH93_004572 [Coemansia aciculifera]|nr:hypothetical protein GGH93_004572 [Coemansia aciculifera]